MRYPTQTLELFLPLSLLARSWRASFRPIRRWKGGPPSCEPRLDEGDQLAFRHSGEDSGLDDQDERVSAAVLFEDPDHMWCHLAAAMSTVRCCAGTNSARRPRFGSVERSRLPPPKFSTFAFLDVVLCLVELWRDADSIMLTFLYR